MAKKSIKRGTRTKRKSGRLSAKFQIPPNTEITYRNFPLLQKFLNDRGKIVPRRFSGVTAKAQRQLTRSIKRARHLALLNVGGIKK